MRKENLRALVRGTYDIQSLRIAVGNRLAMNFRAKVGQQPNQTQEEMTDAEAKSILDEITKEFEQVTDAMIKKSGTTPFKGMRLISSMTELTLIRQYRSLHEIEDTHFGSLEQELAGIPIWDNWLKDVKGIGPTMAAVILSEFDIHKARYPSSLWAYAGLDVADDGMGRSKRKEHLVDREYTAADGTQKTKKAITYNPFLRTKLLGVLGVSFLRSGNERYRKYYDDYKLRMENHATWGKKNDGKYTEVERRASKARRHRQAIRYMMKMFLCDLYNQWRPMENLMVMPTYAEAKLEIVHREERAA